MKYLALAMLFAFVQANPAVPRQTPDANTSKGQPVQNDANANKKPPEQGATVVQKVQSPPNENTNPNKSTQNAEESVRIRELPPVSVQRDWMDCLTLTFSAVLLVVGILGVKAAYRTLKAVEGQVQAQLESLRPRLTVGFEGSQFRPMTKGHQARMVSKIINTGGTPAYHVVVESWIEFLPIPFVDFTPAALYHKGDKFPVFPTQPITYPVGLGRLLTDQEIRGTFAGTHCLCLRLRLSYAAFNVLKVCDFVFGAEPDGVATLRSDAE